MKIAIGAFGIDANLCMLITAVELEENGPQGVCSPLYVDLSPLDVITVNAFACASMKISSFFCDFQKNVCCNFLSNFPSKQTLRCFTSVENFMNFTVHKHQ